MSLTNGELIAFTVLLAPLAVAFGMTLYATWLVYSTRRMLGVPRLRDTSRTFVQRHPRGFVILAFAYILLGMGLIITFAALTWMKKGHWPIALGLVVVLFGMLRECLWLSSSCEARQKSLSPVPLLRVLVGTCFLFLLGAALSIKYHKPGVILVVSSATTYRSWLTLEWGRVLRDTKMQTTFYSMLVQVVALVGTAAASQSPSTFTGLLIISYAFVSLDLAILVLSIRTLHYRSSEATENTSISLDGRDSTASMNKLNRHATTAGVSRRQQSPKRRGYPTLDQYPDSSEFETSLSEDGFDVK